MQASTPCPKCGEYALYRSRSRNKTEKFLKSVLPFKLYRCHACNWRGWLSNRRATRKGSIVKVLFFYALIFFIAFLVTLILRSVIL